MSPENPLKIRLLFERGALLNNSFHAGRFGAGLFRIYKKDDYFYVLQFLLNGSIVREHTVIKHRLEVIAIPGPTDPTEEVIFIFNEDYGSRGKTLNMTLYIPTLNETISMDFFDTEDFPETVSDNTGLPHLKSYVDILNVIKYFYGCKAAEDKDPLSFAFDEWRSLNGGTEEGLLEIRKRKGLPDYGASIVPVQRKMDNDRFLLMSTVGL